MMVVVHMAGQDGEERIAVLVLMVQIFVVIFHFFFFVRDFP